MIRRLLVPIALLTLAGCSDTTAPPPPPPVPAAPQGLYGVTGDQRVTLSWFPNQEQVSYYKVYTAPCPDGDACPYDLAGTTTGTSMVVTGLANGVTLFFAVSAVNSYDAEGPLSKADVFDTPRPQGNGQVTDAGVDTLHAGWFFAGYRSVSVTDPNLDVLFTYRGSVPVMVAPYSDTDIQDAGYTTSFDAVDWAPDDGWAPSGEVELIPGHTYVVWTWDDHYAKFRVTGFGAAGASVNFQWAYQVAQSNPELRARPPRRESTRPARPSPPVVDLSRAAVANDRAP